MDAKDPRSLDPDDQPLFIKSTYVPRQPQDAPAPSEQPRPGDTLPPSERPRPPQGGPRRRKNRNTAGLLALILGGFGVHRFYLGEPMVGVLYLAFSWAVIPSILGLIEGSQLYRMTDDAFDAKYNKDDRTAAGPAAVQLEVVAEELRKLNELFKAGTITEGELKAKREEWLKQLFE